MSSKQSDPSIKPIKLSDDSHWSVHTNNDGRKYYYNKVTKKSQWEMPEELKSSEEQEEVTTPWREYKTKEGEKYYYNIATKISTWDMPEEYRIYMEQKDSKIKELLNYQVSGDIKDQFRSFLINKGLNASWSWEQVLSEIKDDEKWKQIKVADKKAIFQKLQHDFKKIENREKIKKEKKVFDEFTDMLSEWNELDKFTLWREVVEKFDSDSRFRAIVAESQRKKLFEQYVHQKEKAKEDERYETRRRNIEEYRELLKNYKNINSRTKWKDFKEDMANVECFQRLDKIDRIDIFRIYMRELMREEDDLFKKKRQEFRRFSRKARENYRALLADYYLSGKINRKSKWLDISEQMKKEKEYADLVNSNGSTPAELFYDFVDDLGIKFHKDKDKIRDMMKAVGISITADLTYEQWHEAIKKHPDFSSLMLVSVEKMFQELKDRTIDKEEKRKRKAEVKFIEFLEEKITSVDTKWTDVSVQVPPLEAFALINESERENIFNSFMQEQYGSEHEEGAINIPQKKKRSKRKKERRDDDSSDEESRSRSISRSRSPKRVKAVEDVEEGEILD